MDRYVQLRGEVRRGRSEHGLEVERAFLRKIRADRGIVGATWEEERARRRRQGNRGRDVAVAPPMDAAAVEAQFDA